MAFPRTQMRLRRDRHRIGLRPCATCHKFRLFTGFAAGRPPEHPPGRPLRYRIQAMEMSADRKKIHDRPGRQDQNKKISNFFVFLEGICISVLNTIHIREETTRNESHTFLRQDLPTKGRDVLWQPSLEVKI